MTGRIPSRGSDQFNLRLPEGMRDRLRDAAEANGRSMNAEIVARIEGSFEAQAADPLQDEQIRNSIRDIAYEFANGAVQQSLAFLMKTFEELDVPLEKRLKILEEAPSAKRNEITPVQSVNDRTKP